MKKIYFCSFQVTALGQESAQLQEAYPDSADDIAAKQDEIVTAWANLKDKVSYWISFDPFGKDVRNILWLVLLTTKNPFFLFKSAVRKTRLEDSYRLQRFIGDYR